MRNYVLSTILFLCLAGSDLSAQTHNLTWRGAPLSHTKSFLITECGVGLRLTRNAAQQYARNRDVHIAWELGWMRNVNPRWAIGGTSYLSVDGDGSRFALKPRVRRWLSPTLSFDLSAGPVFSPPGLVAELALMKSDLVGITLTYQQTRLVRMDTSPGGVFAVTEGTGRVLSVGVRLGSYPGTAVGVALPVAAVIFVLSNGIH
jgi:hypothetical protein